MGECNRCERRKVEIVKPTEEEGCPPALDDVPNDLYTLVMEVSKLNLSPEDCVGEYIEYLAVCCGGVVYYNWDRVKKWVDGLMKKSAALVGLYFSKWIGNKLRDMQDVLANVKGLKEEFMKFTNIVASAYLQGHERYHCGGYDAKDEEALASAYGLESAAKRVEALTFYTSKTFTTTNESLLNMVRYLAIAATLREIAVEHLYLEGYSRFVNYLTIDGKPFRVGDLWTWPVGNSPVVKLPMRDAQVVTHGGLIDIEIKGYVLQFAGPRRVLTKFSEVWDHCESPTHHAQEDTVYGW